MSWFIPVDLFPSTLFLDSSFARLFFDSSTQPATLTNQDVLLHHRRKCGRNSYWYCSTMLVQDEFDRSALSDISKATIRRTERKCHVHEGLARFEPRALRTKHRAPHRYCRRHSCIRCPTWTFVDLLTPWQHMRASGRCDADTDNMFYDSQERV